MVSYICLYLSNLLHSSKFLYCEGKGSPLSFPLLTSPGWKGAVSPLILYMNILVSFFFP